MGSMKNSNPETIVVAHKSDSYAVLVWTLNEAVIKFRAAQVLAEDFDGEMRFWRSGTTNPFDDPTTDILKADPVIHGSVKFDETIFVELGDEDSCGQFNNEDEFGVVVDIVRVAYAAAKDCLRGWMGD